MLENLLQKWASLAPRDRRMLIIAGCFLLVIIFWQVLLEPAWVGRQRLQKTLPTLRADLAQMDHMAAEARELANAADAPAETVAQVTVRLEQSLLARGMDKEAAKVQAQGDIIEVRFHQAPFEDFLAGCGRARDAHPHRRPVGHPRIPGSIQWPSGLGDGTPWQMIPVDPNR